MTDSSRYAADAVLIVHVSYVAFVVLGQALVLAGWLRGWRWVRNVWFRGAHLVAMLIVVIEVWLGIPCPLTVWEQSLRKQAGGTGYRGDFVAHWLHELVFFDFPPWAFVVLYTAFAALVAATLWLAPPAWRRKQAREQ